MRVLLDESLPRHLARELIGHNVATVQKMGWAGTKNGALLTLAAQQFDAFVTPDRGLEFQQDLSKSSLRIVLVRARSTRMRDLLPLVPGILAALAGAKPGQPTKVDA